MAQPGQYVSIVAWTLAAAGSLFVLLDAGLRLLSIGSDLPTGVSAEPLDILRLANIGLLFLGGLIASKRPENPIGWTALIAGLALGSNGLAEIYAARALVVEPGSLPFGNFSWWVRVATFGVPYACIPLFLLLFPAGQVHSRRWRPFLWLSLVAFAAIFLSAMVGGVGAWGEAFPEPGEGITAGFGSQAFMVSWFALMGIYALSLVGCMSLVFRFRQGGTEQRQQLKWFALAAFALVSGVVALFFVNGSGLPTGFSVAVSWFTFVSQLALYVALAVAVFKYRIYEIDYIINRTVVYGTLTALLAGLYAASIQLFRMLFEDLTGVASAASVVSTTLVFGALFTPAKSRLQEVVDKYFGSAPVKKLIAHDERLQAVMNVLDPEATVKSFLHDSVEAVGARGGAVYLTDKAGTRCVAQTEGWDGREKLRVHMQHGSLDAGFLVLGSPRNSGGYGRDEIESLESSAALVGRVMSLSLRGHSQLPATDSGGRRAATGRAYKRSGGQMSRRSRDS